MNFDNFTNSAFGLWKNRVGTSIVLLGSPGIGKTAAARRLAEMMYEDRKRSHGAGVDRPICEVLDLTSKMPEDIGGIPFKVPTEDGAVTEYAPQAWLPPLCAEGAYGVLVLDDLPAADRSVAVACRLLALERRVHNWKLSQDVFVIVTGNRQSDKSAARALPSHFINSAVILTLKPSYKGWEEWYYNQDADTVVPSYLRFKPDHFSKLPADGDESGRFPTPRTWTKLGQMLPYILPDQVREYAEGLLGTSVATNFCAYREMKDNIVSPEEVLRNPKKAVPSPEALRESPDQMTAIVVSIAEVTVRKIATRREMSGKDPNDSFEVDTVAAFLRALSHLSEGGRNYAVIGVQTFFAQGARFQIGVNEFGRAREVHNKDPDILRMINSIREIIRGGKK